MQQSISLSVINNSVRFRRTMSFSILDELTERYSLQHPHLNPASVSCLFSGLLAGCIQLKVVAFSRNNNDWSMTEESSRLPSCYGRRAMFRAYEQMVADGLILQWEGCRQLQRRTRIWASPELEAIFDAILDRADTSEVCLLGIRQWSNQNNKPLITNTALAKVGSGTLPVQLTQSNQDLARYNQAMQEVQIRTTNLTNTTHPYTLSHTKTNSVRLAVVNELLNHYKSLHRVFCRDDSYTKGGRFYGAYYQQLPKQTRPHITINGKPTVERDFKALHPTKLYNQKGLQAPANLYKLPGLDPVRHKPLCKKSLLISLNAKNRLESINAIYQELKHENQLSLLGEVSLTVYDLYDMTVKQHAPIAEYISSDHGVILQYLDSELAQRIMMRLLDQHNVISLCMHDSFIVEEQYDALLVHVMNDEYRKMHNFDIGVS